MKFPPALGSTTFRRYVFMALGSTILGHLAEGDVAGGCEAFGCQGGLRVSDHPATSRGHLRVFPFPHWKSQLGTQQVGSETCQAKESQAEAARLEERL
jgi:hypothetical protein